MGNLSREKQSETGRLRKGFEELIQRETDEVVEKEPEAAWLLLELTNHLEGNYYPVGVAGECTVLRFSATQRGQHSYATGILKTPNGLMEVSVRPRDRS